MANRSTNHTTRRTRRSAGVMLCAALLAAACGGDDDTGSPTTTTTAAPTTTEAAMADDAMQDDGAMEDDGAMDDDAMDDEGAMEDAMLGAFGPACSAVPADGEGSFAGMADDPAATAASNNPVLSTLVTAVSEAGLVDTLNGDGPFTIFAPTNDAFAAIDEDTLAAVLADKEILTSILTYHVVGGEMLDADALGSAGSVTTVNGADLDIASDGLTIGGASAVCSNVPTANATVHIIDTVLLPQDAIDALTGGGEDAMADLGPTGVACSAVPTDGEGSFAGMADDPAATAASNNPVLSTLVTAVSEAGLVDTLNGEGPFTIFAPTNDAFAAIPADQLAAVLADKDLLTSVLTFHVVAGDKMSSADLVSAGTVTTVNGADLTITADGDAISINGAASSVCMDVPTANATVHIIDSVLLPS